MNQQLLFRKPVPQALVNDTVGRARHAAYHCEWQEAEIKEITDHAMRSTLSGTIRWWERKQVRPLPRSTLVRFVDHWKATRDYYKPAQRGRDKLLTMVEEDMLLSLIGMYRQAQHRKPVDAPTVAVWARAVIEKVDEKYTTGRTLLLEKGGIFVSDQWARDWLKAKGFTYRAATTDRTVSDAEVLKEGRRLYDELTAAAKNTKFHPDLIFNMDEFFCLYDGARRRWTWERVRPGVPIPIGVSKHGFTVCVTSNMSGEILHLHVVHKGETKAVHADIQHPKLTQWHRSDSHFMNSELFERWATWLQTEVAAMQERDLFGGGLQYDDVTPLVIYDQAPQHSIKWPPGWVKVLMPKKMTHVFQPADQYIIAAIKAKAEAKFKEFSALVIKSASCVEEAVKLLAGSCLPMIRTQKVTMLMKAVDELNESDHHCVLASWARTGIVRALFPDNEVDKDVRITYDAIKETASLDVEHLLVDAPDFDDEAEPKYVVVEEVDRTQFVLVDAPPPADNLTAQQGPADDSETRTSREAATERRCQGLR